MRSRVRLDALLLQRGAFPSRARAAAAILAGDVLLLPERRPAEKPGQLVAGDAEAYRYLVESIRRFPPPETFAEMMRTAGFARVSFRPMSGGIVALHSGWRL